MDLSPPSSLAASQNYDNTVRHSVNYFQPPKSPIAAAATPSLASGHDYFSRKRQRPGSAHSREGRQRTASWAETPRWACPTPSDSIHGSGEGSVPVNERYRLADGVDTPGVRSTSRLEQHTVDENEFRRRRIRDDDMDFNMRSGCTPLSGPLARERNGVARVRPASDDHLQRTTWTSLAFNIIGKAFNFGSTVFRGFYAGGGKGYDAHNAGLASARAQHSQDGTSTPIPGSWHDAETDFLGDFEQDSPNFDHGSPSRPAVKRRQTDRDSWVLVDSAHLDGRSASPRRKISGNGVPRASLAHNRPSASRASGRRSLAPVSRRTNSNNQSHAAAIQTDVTPTHLEPHSRRASVAHTRSPQGRPSSGPQGATLVSPEAERFARRQAKQDKAMTSMGNRIQEMMRQAQEALGTKYSVESDYDGMDQEDEGFVDDEDW